MPEGLKPELPKPGDWITLLGVKGIVMEVVPATDWSWLIKANVASEVAGIEVASIVMPTDYHTGDGHYCWGEDDESQVPPYGLS